MTSDRSTPAGPTVHRKPLLSQVPGNCASINEPTTPAWDEPVLNHWELTGNGWEDCHPHTETNVILEGELHVECDDVEVVLRPGDVVEIRANVPARYWAPTYARMISIYGPNPTGAPTPEGREWIV